MNTIGYKALAIIALLLLISCRSKTVYVPVENWKTEIEMLDRWHKDSIYIHDSVFMAHKGDTVFLEKYKYIYRDKLVRDSIYKTDSIRIEVPYPVEVSKPYYPKWLVLLAFGGIALIVGLGYRIIRFFK